MIPNANLDKAGNVDRVIPTYQMTAVSISSAELLAISSTPKLIVPAQGTGKIIVPLAVVGQMKFNSAAYATNEPDFYYGTTGIEANFASLFQDLGAATGNLQVFRGGALGEPQSGLGGPYFDNQPLYFTDQVDWTLGDGDLQFVLMYTVVFLPPLA